MTEVQVLAPREVPLGGLRALTVRRTLPHRDRSFIGAWCFVDHYGPARVGVDSPPMDVAPHPHTGLQTVSWLFEGEIEHRDSGGVHEMVRPGEVNLMTGGSGICHSEVSTPSTSTLHGVQLWVALPSSALDAPRAFDHYAAPSVQVPGATMRVFLGSLLGSSSPVTTHTPLLGAELVLEPSAVLEVPVDSSFEHGVLLDTGSVSVSGVALEVGALGCVDAGTSSLALTAGPSGARIILLGGPPFDEEIVLWWNFVGRTHEDVAAARADWEASSDRFGSVSGYVGERARIPAPELPGVRLKPRGRRGR